MGPPDPFLRRGIEEGKVGEGRPSLLPGKVHSSRKENTRKRGQKGSSPKRFILLHLSEFKGVSSTQKETALTYVVQNSEASLLGNLGLL